jgi:hypothetical protein
MPDPCRARGDTLELRDASETVRAAIWVAPMK